MSASRSSKLEQLQKSLRKHYSAPSADASRSVFDTLLLAILSEDASYDAAEAAAARIGTIIVDYNELRVTTITELIENLDMLPHPRPAAARLKAILQSLFEARYAYDLEDLKKANLGKASEVLSALKGMTKYVHDFVCQHALGAHNIPVDTTTLLLIQQMEIVSSAEAEKGTIPGAERAIPKAKGVEFATLLHSFAADCWSEPRPERFVKVWSDMKTTFEPIQLPRQVTNKVTAKPKAEAGTDAAAAGGSASQPETADSKGSAKKGGKTAAAKELAKEPTGKDNVTKSAGAKGAAGDASPKSSAGSDAAMPDKTTSKSSKKVAAKDTDKKSASQSAEPPAAKKTASKPDSVDEGKKAKSAKPKSTDKSAGSAGDTDEAAAEKAKAKKSSKSAKSSASSLTKKKPK